MMDARTRLLLGILATVGVIAAAWLLAVAPRREHATALGAQVAQAQRTRDDALARAAAAEQARATYARDYATVARLGKAVPVSTDVPSLVFQLESAARRAKVDFRAVTVLDSVPAAPAAPAAGVPSGGGIQPTPFSFKFEGSFFGLQKLLARVDRFSRVKGTQISVDGRLLTIDGLTVSPARQGLPEVQGLVTARAYVADLPDQLPGAATTAGTVSTGSPTSAPALQVTP
jgi:Tfp pilus assembly protein PilO